MDIQRLDKPLHDMAAEEVLALHERERRKEAERQQLEAERQRFMDQRQARIDAERQRDRELRDGTRAKIIMEAAQTQALAIESLLGDSFVPFALMFAGYDAIGVQRHIANRLAALRPNAASRGAADQLITSANQAAYDYVRKLELEQGTKRRAELDAGAP